MTDGAPAQPADAEHLQGWTLGAGIAAILATVYALVCAFAQAMQGDLNWSDWPPGHYVVGSVVILGLLTAPVAVGLGWLFPFHSWRWGLWLTWPQVLVGLSVHRGCPIAPPCTSIDIEPALTPVLLTALVCAAAWLGAKARRGGIQQVGRPLVLMAALVAALFVIQAVLIWTAPSTPILRADQTPFDKDAGSETYKLDGRTVTLTNGVFQESYDAWLSRPRNPYDNATARAAYLSPEPFTTGKVATVELKLSVIGDLSSGGQPDQAVVFTFTTGSDSIYYYVTLRRGQWHGSTTNSILLGDRISVEAVRIQNGKLFVDTVDRRLGESVKVPPSVPVTRVFTVNAGGGLEEAK